MARGSLFVCVTLVAFLALCAGASADTIVLKANLTGKYLHTTSTGSGTVTVTFKGSEICWKFT
jgi:hypothetical protein